jgi:hypothetical protein
MIIDAEFEEIKPLSVKRTEAKIAKLDLILIAIAFAIGYMAF